MSILCKLKLHKWIYKIKSAYPPFFDIEEITRYCERCEKIEKALQFLPVRALFLPIFKDIKEKT